MITLASLTTLLSSVSFYLASFLFVILVVVFVHELGHFLVARWCGVKVTTFSIGFGKEVFGFDDRHGTRWRFALVPLGGVSPSLEGAMRRDFCGRGGYGLFREDNARTELRLAAIG